MTLEQAKAANAYYDKYCEEIKKYYTDILKLSNIDSKIKSIEQLYQYVKEISPELYSKDENFEKNYFAITSLVLKCERLLSNEYVIDIKANYNPNDNLLVCGKNPEDILSYITNNARNFIWTKANHQLNLSLDKFNMVGQCLPVSNYIESLCKEMGIKCKKISLFPGFTQTPILCNGIKQHYAVIVQIDEKEYLIDCTYAQFFQLNRCILERLGIPKLSGCLSGAFMTMNDSRTKVAKKLLKDGWIRLDDITLKDYMDGFALSYRNGIYYEQTNDFSYETNYSSHDYKNFLDGNDNQLNHESETVLDFQKKPLKNPCLIFRR